MHAKKYLLEHDESECKAISRISYGRWVSSTAKCIPTAQEIKQWYELYQKLMATKFYIKKVCYFFKIRLKIIFFRNHYQNFLLNLQRHRLHLWQVTHQQRRYLECSYLLRILTQCFLLIR